jgi:hypothetical protein
MTVSAYPKPATTVDTDQFRDLFRLLISTGAVNNASLQPYADSSGLNVKFTAGFAVIDGVAVRSTAVETRAIGAGSGGSLSRVDTLVANLDFSSTPIIQFAVIAGTPAATGATAPSLAVSGTVVYRWPICDVNVSSTASTILAGDVVDRRSFTGEEVGLWTTGLRPLSPRVGRFGYNTTLNILEFHNGTTWGPITPTALDAGVITTGTMNAARLPTIAVNKGGTGATDAATARNNIGAQVAGSYQAAGSYAASSHQHATSDIIEGVFDDARIPKSGTWTGTSAGLLSGTVSTSNPGLFTGNVEMRYVSNPSKWILDNAGGISAAGIIAGDSGLRSVGAYNTSVSGQAVYISS